MNRKGILVGLASVVMFFGCGSETRKGELVLSGTTPLRIADESGKTVEFGNGPIKIEFSAGSDSKFTVTIEQGQSTKAKFSGRAPAANDWSFTLRGREIGQPTDMASRRNVEYYGEHYRQVGDGGSCGYNGRWVTEDEYQKCNEDWKVDFSDAQTQAAIGNFHSRREALDCHLSSRNIYCREEYPRHEPYPRYPYPRRPYENLSKAQDAVKKISSLVDSGIKFD